MKKVIGVFVIVIACLLSCKSESDINAYDYAKNEQKPNKVEVFRSYSCLVYRAKIGETYYLINVEGGIIKDENQD